MRDIVEQSWVDDPSAASAAASAEASAEASSSSEAVPVAAAAETMVEGAADVADALPADAMPPPPSASAAGDE